MLILILVLLVGLVSLSYVCKRIPEVSVSRDFQSQSSDSVIV